MKNKQIISWFLCLVMFAAFLPNAVLAEEVIEISTAEELAKIGTDDAYPLSGSYKLTADITLPSVEDKTVSEYSNWTPIGASTSSPFTGTFDGDGHSVGMIEIASAQRVGNKGLFGCISNATIKNIKAHGTILMTGSNCPNIAVLVGSMTESTVLNCYATGSTKGTNYVGGLVGQATGSNTIANSAFIGNVAGTGRGPGGIVCSHADNVVINNCYAVVSFDGSTSGVEAVIAGNASTGKVGTIRAYGEAVDGVNVCAQKNTAASTSFVYEVEGLTKDEMQSEEFVQTLNGNITAYGTSDWSEWTYTEGEYPIQKVFNNSGETVTPVPTEEPTATPTTVPTATPTPTPTPDPSGEATEAPSATATPAPTATPPQITLKPTATPVVTPVPTANPVDERSAYNNINFIDYNEYYTDAGEGVVPETNNGGIMTRSNRTDTPYTQYVRFDNVDFGETGSYAAEIYARLTSYQSFADLTLDICLDSTDNVIGSLRYGDTYTASGRNYAVELNTKVTGKHTVYIKWPDAFIGFYVKFIEGTIDLSSADGVISGELAQMRMSENTFIHENSYGDGGPCVQGIGKYGMLDSVSYPAVDFGESGVSKSITIRAARSNAMCVEDESTGTIPPVIRVLLGGRGGEVLGETELLASNADNLGIWKTYTIPLSETISGIHMITVEINYETKLRSVAFDQEEATEPAEVYEEINGHSLMLPEKAVVGDRSIFYGTVGNFVPKYISLSGDMVYNNVLLNDAEYLTAYVRQGASGTFSVFIDDEETAAAEITTSCWAFESVTVPLGRKLSGNHKITLRLKDGERRVPDTIWLKFMTEAEKTAFESRTKIATISDLADRSGYTPYFTQMIDSEKYMSKNFQSSSVGGVDTGSLTAYAPDIVFIMFGGTEAAKQTLDSSFEENYQSLIDALKAANSDVKIYIQTPSPMQTDTSRPNYSGVIEVLNGLASANGAEIIDIYNGMLNSGFPREYIIPDAARANLSDAGLRMLAKLTYNAAFNDNITDSETDKFMLASEADVICNGTGGTYNIGAFQNVTDRHVKTSSNTDKTVVMLKDINLNQVNSMTVEVAFKQNTASVLPVLECRLDSMDGEIIGRFVIAATAKNTEYAFLPMTNSTIPVTDGQLHNLFFILDKGADATGYDVVNLKSIELHRGSALPVVMQDGVILDRNHTINLSDTSKSGMQYQNGGTYTWVTSAEDYTTEARFITAIYDADGMPVNIGISEPGKGRLSTEMTLPDDFNNGGYDFKGYIWQGGCLEMKPMGDIISINADRKIKIGLIGDSTTNNVTVNDISYENICYPNFLRSMMDTDHYEVLNFGRGTATTGSYISGHRIWFELAMSEMCDAYFIMLGTNNAKGVELDEFENNYQVIIDGLREANPDCKIYIMTPIPAQKDKYMIEEKTLTQVIIPMVKNVADNNGLPLIDIYSTLKNDERFDSMYGSDGIHENEEGMIAIAKTVKDVIMSDFN